MEVHGTIYTYYARVVMHLQQSASAVVEWIFVDFEWVPYQQALDHVQAQATGYQQWESMNAQCVLLEHIIVCK